MQMMRPGVAVLLTAFLALAAPALADGLTGAQGEGPMHDTISGAMLEDTRWQAVLVGETPLAPDDGVTIAFADGQATGRSGCNRFTGGYEAGALPDGAVAAPLALGPLAGTRMACIGRGDEIEAQVLAAFERTDGFVLDATGRLLLFSGATVLMVAVPADPT